MELHGFTVKKSRKFFYIHAKRDDCKFDSVIVDQVISNINGHDITNDTLFVNVQEMLLCPIHTLRIKCKDKNSFSNSLIRRRLNTTTSRHGFSVRKNTHNFIIENISRPCSLRFLCYADDPSQLKEGHFIVSINGVHVIPNTSIATMNEFVNADIISMETRPPVIYLTVL